MMGDRASIGYNCTGINEHGTRCGKLLFVFQPPATMPIAGAGLAIPDLGSIEMKCRRCKAMNRFALSAFDTAIQTLQVG